MAKHCDICGKTTVHGQQVSHAHNVTKRTWEPNLQRCGRRWRRVPSGCGSARAACGAAGAEAGPVRGAEPSK
jgi:ribosomal protein L28